MRFFISLPSNSNSISINPLSDNLVIYLLTFQTDLLNLSDKYLLLGYASPLIVKNDNKIQSNLNSASVKFSSNKIADGTTV